jgi:hypothetical protein
VIRIRGLDCAGTFQSPPHRHVVVAGPHSELAVTCRGDDLAEGTAAVDAVLAAK